MVVAWPWESQMVVVLLRLEGAQWQSSVSRPCDEGKAMVVHGQGSMSNRQAMSQCNSQ